MEKNRNSYSRFFLSEVRFLWELAGFWKEKRKLRKIPTERINNPVMILPGFFTNDLCTSPLRKLLRQKGLHCYGWGLGLNKGYHPHTLEKLQLKMDTLYEEHQEPVILIGWSMGGIYARELGRHHPKRIKKIITLGSPFYLPESTPIDKLYHRTAGHKLQELEALMNEHREVEFQVPITAISAKSDGVVPPHTCYISKNGKVKCFDLGTTHMGLPHNHVVIKKILEDLSQN